MKKFLKISLCFVLLIISVLSFSACKKEPQTAYTDHRFLDFEKALIENDIEYKMVMKKDVSFVLGAKEGWGYEIENNYIVELYTFDEKDESYQSFLKENFIDVAGNPTPVKFNGSICIYMSNWQNKKADKIFEIFKNLK